MIGYVTVGTNDIAKAAAFYDELFALLGANRFMDFGDSFVTWAASPTRPALPLPSLTTASRPPSAMAA